jgi:hypothetical protein
MPLPLGLEGRGALGLADDADERADQLGFDLVGGVRRGRQPFHALGYGLVLVLHIGRMGVLDRGVDDGGIGLHEMGRQGLVDGRHQRREGRAGATSAAPPIHGK